MFYKNLNIPNKIIIFPFIIFCFILLNFDSIKAEEPAPEGGASPPPQQGGAPVTPPGGTPTPGA